MLPDFDHGRALLLVVAHPDDESIAAGGHLASWQEARILTITDGSPLDLTDAKKAGCRTRVGYAALRRREQCAALSIAGIRASQCTWLDIVDQQAARNLVPLARLLAEQIDRWDIRYVLTHPFEGGHPDHDAAAFAVHAAVRLLTVRKPAMFEFASYHQKDGQMCAQKFADDTGVLIQLTEEQSVRKQTMLHSHRSQAAMLSNFSPHVECFRRAPGYDFGQPPRECWYEQFSWGIDSAAWRGFASEAWTELSESNVLSV